MGIFGGEKQTKEEKQKTKTDEMMKKYGLDGMEGKDVESAKRIVNDLVGNNFFKAGMALSFAKAEDQAKVTYLSALVEQNWIIIRQLNEISRKLDK